MASPKMASGGRIVEKLARDSSKLNRALEITAHFANIELKAYFSSVSTKEVSVWRHGGHRSPKRYVVHETGHSRRCVDHRLDERQDKRIALQLIVKLLLSNMKYLWRQLKALEKCNLSNILSDSMFELKSFYLWTETSHPSAGTKSRNWRGLK